MTKAQPYIMRNTIQNYAWGTRGESAFIPKLLGFLPEDDTPYAEVWMGAHTKAPSQIWVDGQWQALNEVIERDPEAFLGAALAKRKQVLPFLYKILSAGESLSIQAHPTKSQAEELHRVDPAHYPDNNHKPEIAVALDHLTALVGFMPLGALLKTFETYPELGAFAGANIVAALAPVVDSQSTLQEKRVHKIAQTIINRAVDDPNSLENTLQQLKSRLEGNPELNEREVLFLDLFAQYGSRDVGLIFLFMFNIVHLKRGQAIYTPAGIPHAYLKGNILECMANSDNVVRVGLTPKFKDSRTLIKIIDATPQNPIIMSPEFSGNEVVYMTPATEFELRRWMVTLENPMTSETENHPAVLLVTRGMTHISWGDDQGFDIQTGQSVFIPACLDTYTLSSDAECEIYWCGVPV